MPFPDQDSTQGYYIYLPAQVEVTLLSRTSSSTYADPVTCPVARKRPAERKVLIELGGDLTEEWCQWSVWQVGATPRPRVGDVIVDPAGVRWQVRGVKDKVFENLYACTCQKELT